MKVFTLRESFIFIIFLHLSWRLFRASKKKGVFWKKEKKNSNYNEKFKQYEFFDKQTNVVKSDRFVRMKIPDNKISVIRENYQRYFTLYQKFTNISNIRKKKFFPLKKEHISRNYKKARTCN